jgi:hypothetical protein
LTTRSRKTKATDDTPRCGTCEYFTAEPKDDDGKCRRYPPSTLLSGDDLVFLQPVVDQTGWCGEFRRRVS